MDQRHALQAARHALALVPGRRDLAAALLLHDCGKRHAGLGVSGRAAATLVELLGLPRRESWARYLDHAELGAEELVAAGASEMIVSFARHHAGERPAAFDVADWEVLTLADRKSHHRLSHNQYDGPRQ